MKSIRIALVILPLAAIANIGFFLWSLDGQTIFAVAKAPHWLVMALILSFLPWLTNSLRLLIWSRFFGLGLSWRQVLRIILGTVLGNAVTPTATGAIAVKWAFLVNEDITPDKATTITGLQAAEDSAVSMTLLPLAIIVAIILEVPQFIHDIGWLESSADAVKQTAIILSTILALAVFFFVAALKGLLGDRIKGLAERLTSRLRSMLFNATDDWKHAARTGRKYLAASLLLAIIQWTTRHSIALLIIGFVGGQMMPMLHWVLQWLVITMSSIIPTPGGAGGSEASFLLFFSPFVANDLLGPAMVIWRMTIFYIPVTIAGLIFLGAGWHRAVSKAAD